MDLALTNNYIKDLFLQDNNFSEITAYIRNGRKKQEIIKVNGKETQIKDNFNKGSFSDKFVDWVTVVARKW